MVIESTLLQVIARSSYKTVSVARVARCPRLRLSRARRVNCRQAGKLIARLPLRPVYNHAQANRTIRLSLGTAWRRWPAVAPTDMSSCIRIDPRNRRNALRWFTATEYQIGTPVHLFASCDQTTGGYRHANFSSLNFFLRNLRRASSCIYLLYFLRLKMKIEDESLLIFQYLSIVCHFRNIEKYIALHLRRR